MSGAVRLAELAQEHAQGIPGETFPMTSQVVWANCSRDGSAVVTIGGEALDKVTIWDAKNFQRRHVLDHTGNPMLFAMFSPDGRRLLTANYNRRFPYAAPTSVRAMKALADTPSGAVVWNTSTGEALCTIVHGLGQHAQDTTIEWHRDGGSLLTSGPAKGAIYWRIEPGRAVPILDFDVERPALTSAVAPEGSLAAVATDDGLVRIWKLAPASPQFCVLQESGSLRDGRFSPTNDRVLTLADSGECWLWKATEGTAVGPPLHLPLPDSTFPYPQVGFSHDGQWGWVCFGSRQAARIATAPVDMVRDTVALVDPQTGRVVHSLRPKEGFIKFDFTPNSESLVTVGLATEPIGAIVTFFNLKNGQVPNVLGSRRSEQVASDRCCGTERPNPGAGAARGRHQFVGECPKRSLTFRGTPYRSRLFANGRKLAVLSTPELSWRQLRAKQALELKSELAIWSIDPVSEPVTTLLEHSQLVSHMVISRDGRTLATAGDDGRVFLIDVMSGTRIAVPLIHNAKAVWAEFNETGEVLFTAAENGQVRLWEVSTGDPITAWLDSPSRFVAGRIEPSGGVSTLNNAGQILRYVASPYLDLPLGRALVSSVSGHEVDAQGGYVNLPVDRQAADWTTITAWVRSQSRTQNGHEQPGADLIDACSYMSTGDWEAALYHLDRLVQRTGTGAGQLAYWHTFAHAVMQSWVIGRAQPRRSKARDRSQDLSLRSACEYCLTLKLATREAEFRRELNALIARLPKLSSPDEIQQILELGCVDGLVPLDSKSLVDHADKMMADEYIKLFSEKSRIASPDGRYSRFDLAVGAVRLRTGRVSEAITELMKAVSARNLLARAFVRVAIAKSRHEGLKQPVQWIERGLADSEQGMPRPDLV